MEYCLYLCNLEGLVISVLYHFHIGLDKLRYLTLLSCLAVITEKVKIGQIVLCNSYRNTSLSAKILSTPDIISNSRLELGIGAGWYEQEYLSYGYDFR
jgi:alkanesulfonate monooxygenase SsuD/methylene tetrahydromethanopterin reductase-like flavin-dependent oxidoreductase (luciferase family)